LKLKLSDTSPLSSIKDTKALKTSGGRTTGGDRRNVPFGLSTVRCCPAFWGERHRAVARTTSTGSSFLSLS